MITSEKLLHVPQKVFRSGGSRTSANFSSWQIWNCGECYNSFHLHCVQKWAKDSLFQLSQAMEGATPMEKAALKWCW